MVQVIDDVVAEVLECFVDMEVHKLGIKQNRQELYQSVLSAAGRVSSFCPVGQKTSCWN